MRYVQNVYWSLGTALVILVRFQWNLDCLDRFSKNTQIQNFMKLRRMGAEFFHADGQTDMTKLTVAFRNFTNAPKKGG